MRSEKIEVRTLSTAIARSASFCVLSILFILSNPSHVSAAIPTLHVAHPIGAQRGQELTITLHGANLTWETTILTDIPGTFELLTPASRPADAPKSLQFKAKLAADIPTGVYPISVHTADGVSNRVLFTVGPWPIVFEKDPNESPKAAQALQMPVVVNGSLTPADQDYYRITAAAGQRIVIETEAQRLGMGADTTLELFDAAGKQVAMNDDAPGLGMDSRIDAVLPAAGEYVIYVHDTKFGSVNPNQYRLKVGETQFAETLFPLGGPREGERDVKLLGGNLSQPMPALVTDVQARTVAWTTASLSPEQSAALPFKFAVGNGHEIIEPRLGGLLELEPGVVMNGRIAKPGEVDLYQLPARPGERWHIDVEAASLGTSQLDGLLTVYDDNRKRIALADDGNQLDPQLRFTVPAHARRVLVTLEDLHGRGGDAFGYRLTAYRPTPDFSIRVLADRVNIPRDGWAQVPIEITRSAYNGPVQARLDAPLTDVVAEDGLIPAGKNKGMLMLKAKHGATPRYFDLPIVGVGGPAAQPWVRRADPVNVPSPSNAYVELPAAIREYRALIRLEPAMRHVVVPQGEQVSITVNVSRDSGIDGEITWVLREPVPPGRQPVDLQGKIEAKTNQGSLTLRAHDNDRMPNLGEYTLFVAGKVKVGEADIEELMLPITVEVIPAFSVRVLEPAGRLHPGDEAQIVALLERASPFDGPVKIGAIDLPPAITAEEVELAAGTTIARIKVKASPEAALGKVDFHLRASTHRDGVKRTKEYLVPDADASLEIVAKPPASQPASQPAAGGVK